MTVKAQQIIDIVAGKNHAAITEIINEYRNIKYKLQNSKSQSWYFQKAIGAKKLRLVTLTKKFEAYREQFNQISLDELIKMLNNTYDEEKKIWKRDHMGLQGHMALAATLSKRRRFNEFIVLKNRVKELMPIEYYVNNPEALAGLMG
jgi:hypothetical protein